MDTDIQVNGKMMRKMVKEWFIIITISNMKENLKMIYTMDQELECTILMDSRGQLDTLDNSKMI